MVLGKSSKLAHTLDNTWAAHCGQEDDQHHLLYDCDGYDDDEVDKRQLCDKISYVIKLACYSAIVMS